MVLSPEAKIYLRCAANYLGERTNVAPALREAKKDPQIVQLAIEGLDSAITELNRFILRPKALTDSQKLFLPNAWAIKREVTLDEDIDKDPEPYLFPTATQLALSPDRYTHQSGQQTWQEAGDNMRYGEVGGNHRAWKFHIDITDPAVLADSLALELYGEYAPHHFSELEGKQSMVVNALEEMLAVHGQHTRIFNNVQEWISAEEGFSQPMVDLVGGRAPVPFSDGQIIRQTPNYIIYDGYKAGLEQISQKLFLHP